MFAFCVIFIPYYVKIKQRRYNAAWCSPTTRLASDHFTKIKEYLKTAVELFNELHSDTPILTKEDNKNITDNSEMVQFDRETANGVIPYSACYQLSLNNKSINAGYTLHLIVVDR